MTRQTLLACVLLWAVDAACRGRTGEPSRSGSAARLAAPTTSSAAKRPNVLWLTCEDMSCNLGCYGDKDAITPNLLPNAVRASGLRNANGCLPW